MEPAVKWTEAQLRGMDALASGASHIALLGGSRSGKTFLLCYAVLARAIRSPGSRHAIFRFRLNALKSSIVADTMPKVIKLCFPDLPAHDTMLNKQDLFLTLPNGSEIWYGGLDDKERTEKILGMEFATIYFNECSQIPWGSIKMALTRLAMKAPGIDLRGYYDFNPPSEAHWTFQLFMKLKSPDSRMDVDPSQYAWSRLNPRDNVDNLGAGYIQQLEQLPERDRLRFLEGLFSSVVEGPLWTQELIDQQRVTGEIPQMVRYVVAVDPSGCSGDEDVRSDEVGIVVCGLGVDGNGYVLEDLSGRHGPSQWAKIACSAYERYRASAIVAEKNFGGAMVEEVIRSQGQNVNVKLVTASHGKAARAEPIAALYEREKIYHVGFYPEMEEQMCAFSQYGYQGTKSPDRADTLVWGMTELFPAMIEAPQDETWVPPSVVTRSRSSERLSRRF